MRRFLLALLLVVLVAPAFAQSAKFKAGTVSIGDSVEKLLKVAGKPDRIQPFPGMPAFQRYDYFSNGRNITVTVKSGKSLALEFLISPASSPPGGVAKGLATRPSPRLLRDLGRLLYVWPCSGQE